MMGSRLRGNDTLLIRFIQAEHLIFVQTPIQKDYVEMCCFGASVQNDGIINFYLNNIDFLEQFILYFKDRAANLIKMCGKSPVILPESMMPAQECVVSNKKTRPAIDLSPRTIENHLDALKTKLNCQYKSEIIDKVVSANFLLG